MALVPFRMNADGRSVWVGWHIGLHGCVEKYPATSEEEEDSSEQKPFRRPITPVR